MRAYNILLTGVSLLTEVRDGRRTGAHVYWSKALKQLRKVVADAADFGIHLVRGLSGLGEKEVRVLASSCCPLGARLRARPCDPPAPPTSQILTVRSSDADARRAPPNDHATPRT